MASLEKLFVRSTASPGPGKPELLHFARQIGEEKSRIHLRLDPGGEGTLVVNANRILHLNPTAALMARMILAGQADAGIVRAARRKYHVSGPAVQRDVSAFRVQLEELIRPDGACPLHELEIDSTMPFSARPSAPYRMDLALTYRCNNDCPHCYNSRRRDYPEMDTAHWKRILDLLWSLGVPHIVFTGGEPTLRSDLPDLIAHAESLGHITGLNTNARRLADPRYVQRLVDSGLDHVQITVESHDADIHGRMVGSKNAFSQTIEGLKNILDTSLYVMTNTTMLQTNVHTIPATLDFLADLGVPTVGLNALIYSGHGLTVGTGLREAQLQGILDMAAAKTSARGQRLIWYTPTQYCEFDPTQHNLGAKGCTAALYSMCIESDGSVLPCQSYYEPLGKLLTDTWSSIWNHELSVRLRERRALPEKCSGCGLAPACGGGCPLQFQSTALPAALGPR